MAYFTVHEDSDLAKTRARDGGSKDQKPLLIKEGFSWVAFFLPVVWPLFYGQVASFLILFLGIALISALALSIGLPLFVLAGIVFAANLAVAFEANNWRRRIAARGGSPALAIAEGRSLRKARAHYLGEASAPQHELEVEDILPARQERERAPSQEWALRPTDAPSNAEQTLWAFLGLRDRPFVPDHGAFGPPDFKALRSKGHIRGKGSSTNTSDDTPRRARRRR